ncbi:MAG: esterase/lipase family protein [Pseudomonadales bacterium]
MLEAARLSIAWPLLLQLAKPGDGHPVMVLPGFMGGDSSTLMLRRFLTRLGYVTLPWLQGTNSGRPEQLEAATLRFFRAHSSMGSQISLVGQSLGGIYAREIARSFPHAVRCVITLGSPFGANGNDAANPAVARLFEAVSGLSVEDMRAQSPKIDPRTPLGLPSTAIYSKSDGVVAWHSCLEQESALSENVEVVGSHSGMAMNADVLHVVADRLLQRSDNWQKFDRGCSARQWTYPKAATPANL